MKVLILLLTILTLTSCAEHTQHSEVYLWKTLERYETQDFNISLVISENHDSKGNHPSLISSAFYSTHQNSGYPYRLLIASRYYGKEVDTTKIVELDMQVADGQKMNLLEAEEIEISYHPPQDPTMPGTIGLPLGDELFFYEGQKITVTMKFIPPNSKEAHTISQVFVGKTKSNSYNFIDILNSV